MKRNKMNHITLDLVLEIIIRLPSKSLVRFKCVSKTWCSIIQSQSFIDTFFLTSSKQSRFIIAFTNGIALPNHDKRLFIFSSSHEGQESSSLLTYHDMTIPHFPVVNNPASGCVSVHGFIGCSLYDGFMVCNPSTRQVIVLPKLPRRPAQDLRGTCLGYDPVSGQFKVLSLIASRIPNHDRIEHLVLTLEGDKKDYRWRHINQGNNNVPPYNPDVMKVCINGVVYYGAWTPKLSMNPVVVCFDVRTESISFIKAPDVVVGWRCIFMEYKGKLASIVRNPYARFNSFDLWVLKDLEWSKQTTCVFPFSVWDCVFGDQMWFPGTNKAGEIILAPTFLSRDLGPYYIFYYNVETKSIRRVRLKGIGDDEEFRHCCGIGSINVYISPQHAENLRLL